MRTMSERLTMSDRRGLEGFPMKPNPHKIVKNSDGIPVGENIYDPDDEIPDYKGYAADQLLFDDTLDESHI